MGGIRLSLSAISVDRVRTIILFSYEKKTHDKPLLFHELTTQMLPSRTPTMGRSADAPILHTEDTLTQPFSIT